jgi:hypothetical protein
MKLELTFINLIILYLIEVRQFQCVSLKNDTVPNKKLTKNHRKLPEMPQNMRTDFLDFTPQNRDVEPKSVPGLQLKLSLKSIDLLYHFLAKKTEVRIPNIPQNFLIEFGPHKNISEHRLNGPGLKNQKNQMKLTCCSFSTK